MTATPAQRTRWIVFLAVLACLAGGMQFVHGQEPTADPRTEAVQLSAFIEHFKDWQRQHPGKDPYVLIAVNGYVHPVRGGVKESDRENAIQVEWLDARTIPLPATVDREAYEREKRRAENYRRLALRYRRMALYRGLRR